MIEFESATDAFYDSLSDIIESGVQTSPRGMGTYEMLSYGFRINNPRNRIVYGETRDMRMDYAAAGVAWNLALRDDVETICWWNPNGHHFSDDGKTFHGANYGQRIIEPLSNALTLLKHDPETRRAWVPIYDGYRDGGVYSLNGKDVPCTIGFGLRLESVDPVGDNLIMQVIMRSQSWWGVFPYDFFLFSVLHELCANTLGASVGPIDYFCMSAHIYERDLEKAKEYLEKENSVMDPDMSPILATFAEASNIMPQLMDSVMRNRPVDDVLTFQGEYLWNEDPGMKQLYDMLCTHRAVA